MFTPAEVADLPFVRDLDVRVVLDRPEAVRRWDRPFHLEIDTGMSRCGVRWDDEAAIVACRSPHLEGVFTHLHSADVRPETVAEQWERFVAARRVIGPRPPLVHVANSAAVWRAPEVLDLARPGIYLYGGEVAPDIPAPAPVLALGNLREIAALAPKMNLAGDPQVDQFAKEIEALAKPDPEKLRSDKDVRNETQRKAEELARKMSAYNF